MPFLYSRFSKHLRALVPLIATLIIIGLPFLSPTVRSTLADAAFKSDWYPSMLDLSNNSLYRGLSQFKSGVVAVRLGQAEYIAALTPHYVVAVRGTHIGDYRTIDERQIDNDKIINFAVSAKEMRQLLNKYYCNYVIVPKESGQLVEFRKNISIFSELMKTEDGVLFAVKS
jgi:hypothetical protein